MIRLSVMNSRRLRFYLGRLRMKTPYLFFIFIDGFISLTVHNRFNLFPFHDERSNFDPVVIVGPGRSGTTLLKRELSADFEIFFPPELPNLGQTIRVFSRVRRRSWDYVVEATLDAFRISADVTIKVVGQEDYNLKTELDIDWNSLKAVLKNVPQQNQNLSHILFAIVSHHYTNKMRPGVKLERWGDKTPWNIFHLPNLRRTFPNATYVFMVRKPVPVVSSYLKAFRASKGMRVNDATFRWILAINLILRSKNSIQKSTIVKYEQFVETPKKYIDTVAKLANLKRRTEPVDTLNVASDIKLLHHSNLNQAIFVNKESDVPQYLTQEEVDFVERKTDTALGSLDYE